MNGVFEELLGDGKMYEKRAFSWLLLAIIKHSQLKAYDGYY